MKWGYIDKEKDVVYLDTPKKVELFVPVKPLRVLMLFKNNTANDYVVADYLTGLKIGSCKTRKSAKELLTNENSLKVETALNLYKKNWNKTYPEINKLA